MRRFSVVAVICAVSLAAISFSDQPATSIEGANRLFKEKSYELARQQYDALLAQVTDPQQKREAQYMRALSLKELGQRDDARQGFQKIADEDTKDLWAGRAEWRLAAIMTEDGVQPEETTPVLSKLRMAESILGEAKSDDLVDFHRDVAFNLLNRIHPPQQDDRDYLFSFFDKLIPLLKDPEQIAETHWQKANRWHLAGKGASDEDWLSQRRAIVSEFPDTKIAPRVQLEIANRFLGRGDLVVALKEFRELARRWPNSPESKQAQDQGRNIEAEQVAFQLSSAFLPGEPVVFELQARNVRRATLTLHPFDPVRTLKTDKQQRLDLRALSTNPSTLVQQVDLEKHADYTATTTSVVLGSHAGRKPAEIEPGTYVLKATAGAGSAYGLLIVSEILMVQNGSSTAMEFWVVDAKTGKPRPNAEITVGYQAENTNTQGNRRRDFRFTKFADLRTDESGFADMRGDGARGALFAVARNGKHCAILGYNYWYPRGQTANAEVYVYPDRPVYRPNEKVNWRALIRDRKDGDYLNVAGRTFTVRIQDPRGNEVLKDSNFTASGFGTLNGEMKLGERPALGQYTIRIWSNDTGALAGNGNFRVEEYKKPEYDVAVSTADSLYRMGGTVRAQVEAKYYFGAPVADAQVQYTVRRREHWVPWWRMGRQVESGLGWFDTSEPDEMPRHGSEGAVVATGTGKTGADGRFPLEFVAEFPPREEMRGRNRYWWQPPWRAFDFQIEVTVTDKSRRNIDGSRTVVASDTALQVSAKPKQHLYTPGDLVKVDLQSRNFSDDPVPSSGTLYVEKLRWDETTEKDEITTLSSNGVETGAEGSLSTSWRVPRGETGRFRFLFEANDPFAGKTHAYGEFTVADENTRDIFFKYQGVEIIADKDTYEVGDTARIMLLSEFRDAVAWYWIDSGNGNLDKRVIPLPDRTNFVKVPITGAFVPNSKLHIVSVRDKRIISDDIEIIVPPKRRVLSVSIKPDRATYKPGKEGTIEITATDWSGKPAQAEFSVAMFDKSILYISPETREDVRRAFYGTRRQLQSSLRNSVEEPGSYNQADPSGNLWFLRHAGAMRMGGNYLASELSVNGFADAHYGGFAVSRSMLAAAPAMSRDEGNAGLLYDAEDGVAAGVVKSSELIAPEVRSDFRDSILWSPSVVTGPDGRASAKVRFPDSLTTWRAVAVGITADTLVGNDSTETLVQKNLLVRLQAPRFFRERDKVTLSGVVHNYLDHEKEVRVRLAATGVDVATGEPAERIVKVTPNGEKRVDWVVDVKQWGDATIRVEALTDEESDAVAMKFPVLPHGIDKFVAWNGSSTDQSSGTTRIERKDGETLISRTIEIPRERIQSSSRLTVTVSPSLASAICGALPYLVDYPYGCVEQTMSRFLPAAVVAATFRNLDIPRDDLLETKLKDVMKAGLERIADFQRPDGGWGWWKDDNPNDYMTAYVMYGLTLARKADYAVDDNMFSRGLDALRNRVRKFDAEERTGYYWRHNSLHTLAFQLFVLALNDEKHPEALDHVWLKREELTATGLGMLARTLWRIGRQDDARIVLRNMYNFAVISEDNGTARWGKLEKAWYWWDDAVEATAMGLEAYLEIQPDDPMCTRAMKWLVLNREGRQWKSSKDTGKAVLALASYIREKKENVASGTLDIRVGNLPVKSFTVSRDNFWKFDGTIVLEGDAVPDGNVPVEIRTTGNATVFYSIYAGYFTLEEGIRKAGNEIFVERVYEKLVRESVKSTTGVVAVDRHVPIHDGDTVASGDELRVTLKIKSLNDYEYLVFEDPKPAGMEPVAVQSGTVYGSLCSNMELRDQFLSFFITYLPQGEHTITYNCRAEVPGTFHTMPTKGYAMYFPPLRANADELVISVKDSE